MEAKFNKVVVFSVKKLQQSTKRWKNTLIGKFLGRGLPLDFVPKEMRARWNMEGHFQVSLLSDGLLLSEFLSETMKNKVLDKGPSSLAR